MAYQSGASQSVDITPHPRILRMLGEIAFEPQKCVGELIDNAIDGFLRTPRLFSDSPRAGPEIVILVPHRDQLGAGHGEIVIEDNGPGMTLSQIADAAKAGYSANSPIENLGLFGMGFNIATARLGNTTELRSGVAGETSWNILEIDLAALQRQGSFVVSPRFESKSASAHGTRVTIRQLKTEQAMQIAAGVRGPTRKSVAGLRTWIGRTYTKYLRDIEPRLANKSIRIIVNGELVRPYRWCVWGKNRYVDVGAATRLGSPDQISAYKEFDQVLGGGLYCLNCLSWQPNGVVAGNQCAYCHETRNVERVRRMKGWIGVQRHLSEDEYGFDFIRNGRAILQWDRRVFAWADPNTGRLELEYPIDEPRARHGRIVGEIEIDHVPVHYQKDSFEEESWLWREVIDNLRGLSPLRPQVAEKRGMLRNESLLQSIYRGYNRTRTEQGGRFGGGVHERRDPWARDLIINQEVALEYHRNFIDENPEYQTDDKWYEWLVDADATMSRQLANPGTGTPTTLGLPPVIAPPHPQGGIPRTERQRLSDNAVVDEQLTGTYGFEPHRVLDVTVQRISENLFREQGSIRHAVPVVVFPELRGTVDCFYDETHPRIVHDEADVRDLIIAEVAVLLRDRYYDRLPYSFVLDHLRQTKLPDVSRENLTRSASRLINELWPRFVRAFEAYSEGDTLTLRGLLGEEDLRQLGRAVAEQGYGQDALEPLLNTGEFLTWMPHLMGRILRLTPERFLDNKLFTVPYRKLPQGLNEAELFDLALRNVSRVANPLEDLANATRPSRVEPVAVERLVRLRAFRSIDLVRALLEVT